MTGPDRSHSEEARDMRYFIDALRGVLRLDPLYRDENYDAPKGLDARPDLARFFDPE